MLINKIWLLIEKNKQIAFKIILIVLLGICLCLMMIILTSCGTSAVENVTTTTFVPNNAQQDLQKALDVVAQQNAIIQQKNEQLEKHEEIAKQQRKLAELAEQKLTEELKQKQIKEQKHQVALQAVKKFHAEKEILQERLNSIIEQTQNENLQTILKSKEAGGHGIYIIHNETNNKYYIGQAKQCIKRIKQHFNVEDLSKDFLKGDHFSVQIIPSRSLPKDYELNHMEKATIEMYKKNKHLYNKTDGNLAYLDEDLDIKTKDLIN